MAGAVGLGLVIGDAAATLMPLLAGLLAVFVAYGRWRRAPHRATVAPGVAPARRLGQLAGRV